MRQISPPNTPWLLYLHGFQSSPLSEKAVITQAYLAEHFPDFSLVVPELANNPKAVIGQLKGLLSTDQHQCFGIIGSSLGGFYADWLGGMTKLPRVLVNPVVSPVLLLVDYLGEHQNPYTKKRFTLSQQDLDYFLYLEDERQSFLEQSTGLQKDILLLVEEGDDTLDYAQAVSFFKKATCVVEENGHHRFENYEKWLPYLLKFLNLP